MFPLQTCKRMGFWFRVLISAPKERRVEHVLFFLVLQPEPFVETSKKRQVGGF